MQKLTYINLNNDKEVILAENKFITLKYTISGSLIEQAQELINKFLDYSLYLRVDEIAKTVRISPYIEARMVGMYSSYCTKFVSTISEYFSVFHNDNSCDSELANIATENKVVIGDIENQKYITDSLNEIDLSKRSKEILNAFGITYMITKNKDLDKLCEICRNNDVLASGKSLESKEELIKSVSIWKERRLTGIILKIKNCPSFAEANELISYFESKGIKALVTFYSSNTSNTLFDYILFTDDYSIEFNLRKKIEYALTAINPLKKDLCDLENNYLLESGAISEEICFGMDDLKLEIVISNSLKLKDTKENDKIIKVLINIINGDIVSNITKKEYRFIIYNILGRYIQENYLEKKIKGNTCYYLINNQTVNIINSISDDLYSLKSLDEIKSILVNKYYDFFRYTKYDEIIKENIDSTAKLISLCL